MLVVTTNDIDDRIPMQGFSVPAIAKMFDVSRSKIYLEIQAGRLIARKLGGRTIFLKKDIEAWADALPKMSAATVDDDPLEI